MPQVIEDIPVQLQPAAEAALAWVNQDQGANYKLTGLVDPDLHWNPEDGDAREMGLVLCENDMCSRSQVRIQKHGDGFQVSGIDDEVSDIPAHLDPPAGVRENWIDEQLAKHKFVVFVFYRGLW